MNNNDTKLDAVKVCYLEIFQTDIQEHRLENIQKLYDAAHITNNMLVEQIHRHAGVVTDLSNAVFNDIAHILAENIAENAELEDFFDEIYYTQYKDIYDTLRKAATIAESGGDPLPTLSPLARKVMAFDGYGEIDELKMKNITKTGRYRMMQLIQTRSDVLTEIVDPELSGLKENARNWNERKAGTSELYLNDKYVIFTSENEPVFQSTMYEKFKRRMKQGIADELGIPVEALEERFYSDMALDIRPEDLTFLPSYGDGGIANMAATNVVQINYGGSQWLQSITSTKSIRKGSFGYRPDFEKLLDCYCRARVFNKFAEVVNSGEDFNRLTLSRECKSASPKEDYSALLYLYNIDIVYQMFKVMQEQYYRNFSWEGVLNKNLVERSQNIISEMRAVISSKDRVISDLHRRLDSERKIDEKVVSNSQLSILRENKALLDDIEEKDREIEALKARIRYQEELLESFSTPEDDSAPENVDMDALRQHRYLFVGHTEEDHPQLAHELKSLFPDSVFMNSETTVLDNIIVDAVVVFINWTSHGMYYRLKSAASVNGLPMLYCKARNPEKIYQEMQSLNL